MKKTTHLNDFRKPQRSRKLAKSAFTDSIPALLVFHRRFGFSRNGEETVVNFKVNVVSVDTRKFETGIYEILFRIFVEIHPVKRVNVAAIGGSR